jgi:hypothetical protein
MAAECTPRCWSRPLTSRQGGNESVHRARGSSPNRSCEQHAAREYSCSPGGAGPRWTDMAIGLAPDQPGELRMRCLSNYHRQRAQALWAVVLRGRQLDRRDIGVALVDARWPSLRCRILVPSGMFPDPSYPSRHSHGSNALSESRITVIVFNINTNRLLVANQSFGLSIVNI